VKTLYRASRVRTLSRPGEGEWLLVDGRHVERVGVGEPPGADRTVDLPGTVVLPGFVDAHVHLTGTTLSMIGIPIERARSAEELLGIVAEEVSHGPTKVLAHGFDESTWEVQRFPTLNELDETFTMPVVLIRADGHLSLVNTATLQTAEALDTEGVERDPEGRPTGVVRGEANGAVQRWFHQALTDHELRELQLQATGLAASRGVTFVHEMAIPSSHGRREVEVLLEHRRQLPVDVAVYVAEEDIPWILDLGLETIGGDLSLDGSIGARTAALSEPYADGDGDRGTLNAEDDRVAQFFHSAHTAGLQASVHAIGDAAIEQAIRAWERVYQSLDSRQRRHFRARRHRIEHVEMVNQEMIERAAMLGLGLSVQPAFDAVWGQRGQLYEQRLGRARASTMNPFSTFVGRGLVVGAGSDSPITALDPLFGVWSLENHHDPSERMTRQEAVDLWTSGGAALAHQEEKKGRLAPGMHADFAVYEADPIEAEDPRELRPILTVSRGREVFAR
jgi:predicted amidohydrolase YtcJ